EPPRKRPEDQIALSRLGLVMIQSLPGRSEEHHATARSAAGLSRFGPTLFLARALRLQLKIFLSPPELGAMSPPHFQHPRLPPPSRRCAPIPLPRQSRGRKTTGAFLPRLKGGGGGSMRSSETVGAAADREPALLPVLAGGDDDIAVGVL